MRWQKPRAGRRAYRIPQCHLFEGEEQIGTRFNVGRDPGYLCKLSLVVQATEARFAQRFLPA